jgi:hypothetical protein
MDWGNLLTGGTLGSNLQGIFDASAAAGARVGLGEQRTADTVTTDAIRTLTPVNTSGVGAQFGNFWAGVQGVLGNVAQIELQRYANKRIGQPGEQAPAPAAPAPAAASSGPKGSTMLLIGGGVLAVGLVAFLALRK